MLTPYRALLATPGALRFTAFGYLARLGGAMFGVSIIVMIATRRGSYSSPGSSARSASSASPRSDPPSGG
ncbi:hypothetical protein [Arsenicicoccus piscis]|uniref:MFS transporter n=1 Tax=Arsenicicoccus piscis TaxID=673954 RepID=A0ABQ6HTI3_9MICO|nr:hypothetical protein [Arsenicicoccus piscis]GMA20993.1 hypothetical protein GCM10025862_30140 [Arsenicicoccus piscis]